MYNINVNVTGSVQIEASGPICVRRLGSSFVFGLQNKQLKQRFLALFSLTAYSLLVQIWPRRLIIVYFLNVVFSTTRIITACSSGNIRGESL